MSHKSITNHATVGKHPDRLSHPASATGRIGHAAEPSDCKTDGFSHILKSLLLPAAASALTGLLSVTIMTAAAGASPDPGPLIPVLSAAALAVASLVGGITAGLCRREHSTSSALVSGCLLSALLCIVALAVKGSPSASPVIPWLIRLSPIPLHTLGGLLTRPRPQKASHTAAPRR